jgi:hypothetical protein
MSNDVGRETILIMLLTECVRRLTKNGKNPIHINNRQIEKILDNKYEVDYGSSDGDKFILKLVKGEEISSELSPTQKDDEIILTEYSDEE